MADGRVKFRLKMMVIDIYYWQWTVSAGTLLVDH